VERFREDLGEASSAAGGAGVALAPAGSLDSTTTDPAPPVAATSGATPSPSEALPDAGAPGAVPADLRPASGVYRYRTTGGEEVPFINAQRAYPAETTATAWRASGCGWRLRFDFLQEHNDEYGLCTTASGLTMSSLTITIEWFYIRRSVALTCRPDVPLLVTGDTTSTSTTDCAGDDIRAQMIVTQRPPVDLVVEGASVHAARVDWRMEIGGMFEGTGLYQLWLEPTTGLPLKVTRAVDATGDTPLGRQRYVEHHTATLVSLQPLR
jgi:hypothetical protein